MTSVCENVPQDKLTPAEFLMIHPNPCIYSTIEGTSSFRYVCKHHNPGSKTMYFYGYVNVSGTETPAVKIMAVRPRGVKHPSPKVPKTDFFKLFKTTFKRVFKINSNPKKSSVTCQPVFPLKTQTSKVQYLTKKEIEEKRASVWKPLTPLTLTAENCKSPKIRKLPVIFKRQPKLRLALAKKNYNKHKAQKKLEKRSLKKLSLVIFKKLSLRPIRDSHESVEIEHGKGNPLRLSPTTMNLSSLTIDSSISNTVTDAVQSTLTLAMDMPPPSNLEGTQNVIPMDATSTSEKHASAKGFKNKLKNFLLTVTRRKN